MLARTLGADKSQSPAKQGNHRPGLGNQPSSRAIRRTASSIDASSTRP